jgi:hypothetical protein
MIFPTDKLTQSWYDLQISKARDPVDLIANAQINGTEAKKIYSTTFSTPPANTLLKIVALRVITNIGGARVLAYANNPLSTFVVSTIDKPNIIEVDFNIAPTAATVTPASFVIIDPAAGPLAAAVAMTTSTTAQLLLTPANPFLLPGKTYLIQLDGTTVPVITSSGAAMDGEALGLPSGDGVSGGDFLLGVSVLAGPVPPPATPATLPSPTDWSPSSLSLSSSPFCTALRTDNHQKVAEAAQWNFSHGVWNNSSGISTPLRNLIYLRGGLEWQMNIPINFGSRTYNDVQLGFLVNSATVGDWLSKVPVLSFTGLGLLGAVTLQVTLKRLGNFSMGLRAIDSFGVWSLYESDWAVVP